VLRHSIALGDAFSTAQATRVEIIKDCCSRQQHAMSANIA
jgi:hypothetical protein